MSDSTEKAPQKAVKHEQKALKQQPEVNIGTIGHVDHGKTTLVESLTGVWASRHSEELKRGITIKLGYADAVVYKCPKCESPHNYSTQETCPRCGSKGEYVRGLSFVDAPGHEALMATMLSGAAVMDGVILVIAADEPCPQPQTREHLAAIEIVGINKIVIAQNKVDLVDRSRALKSYQEIKAFTKGTIAEKAPIVPISAQNRVNIDILLYMLEQHIPTPIRDPAKPPRLHVVRSFDVNKPGTPIDNLVGGVIGGSIFQGVFKVGDEIEIRPGITKPQVGSYEPLFTEIVSLHTGGRQVKEAYCGGLVGVGTLLDPSLTKADGLIGNIVGRPGTLPPTRLEMSLEFHLFERAVGTKEMLKVEGINVGEVLLLDVGTAPTVGKVVSKKKDVAEMQLTRPVCAEDNARVAVSRKIGGRWRLIGFGIIK
ncbi:MAG: translation initiation factor IF-2 subunit gamma [Candidatus Bathyarchaeia archaeon]